jgi:hypothetical protein
MVPETRERIHFQIRVSRAEARSRQRIIKLFISNLCASNSLREIVDFFTRSWNHFLGARCCAGCFRIRIAPRPSSAMAPNPTAGFSLSPHGSEKTFIMRSFSEPPRAEVRAVQRMINHPVRQRKRYLNRSPPALQSCSAAFGIFGQNNYGNVSSAVFPTGVGWAELRPPLLSKTGAVCGSAARTDLRGGRPAMTVPTATHFSSSFLLTRIPPNFFTCS